MGEEPSVAVHCSEVVKQFGRGETRVMALRGVNLKIHTGELTILEGPSGCGKTTLLSVIAGLLDPTAGQVEVLKTALPKLTDQQKVGFRRRHLGFVFQEYNLLPALTAAENAAVPLVIAGKSRRQALERAEHLLERMDLDHRTRAQPSTLSGGEQQRVAIARALVHEPELVLCDEPTASLDAQTGQNIMHMLRDTAVEAGRAVIVVTHDPRIFDMGDRIASMEDGKIVKVQRAEERSKS